MSQVLAMGPSLRSGISRPGLFQWLRLSVWKREGGLTDLHRAMGCERSMFSWFSAWVKSGRAIKKQFVDVFENDDTYIIQWKCMELGSCIIGVFKYVLFSTRNS